MDNYTPLHKKALKAAYLMRALKSLQLFFVPQVFPRSCEVVGEACSIFIRFLQFGLRRSQFGVEGPNPVPSAPPCWQRSPFAPLPPWRWRTQQGGNQ